ncbi:histidine phosphatase family protein [Alkalihalobacterium chitinilyticum]|uniref:Histidine phosphatase family protein n=1 Tax=Alkalihalobacterium chitinilyticum TaxID=2980103 RepID=A0ABT5V9N0_9BACI|nr:histidine phosphatase family protein [Alkalihalobacterium chitinilyticum]MDE5411990.1 histidine phosphatase family protein [Alkalihalobacterium chitinilyticum]
MACRLAVTLLRHSITDYNEQKRYLGWTDLPINTRGKQLLSGLKKKHRYIPGNVIYSSDLTRCVTTAEILYPNVPIIKDKRLREINFGDWEGKTYEEIKDDPLYRRWLDDLNNTIPPNGEAYLSFQSRIINSWNKIINDAIQQKWEHIIVVSHGGPIRFILSQMTSEKKSFWEWNIDYGQGYTLTTEIERLRRGEQWNLLQVAPFMANETGCIQITK